MPHLVFVYNADSGLFNTVADIAHKLFSPKTYHCQLCLLTYGNFSIREEWEIFLREADFESEFLHRDEFEKAYAEKDPLPALYRREGEKMVLCAGAADISACDSIDALKSLISTSCL